MGLHCRRDIDSKSPRELTRCALSDVDPPFFLLPAVSAAEPRDFGRDTHGIPWRHLAEGGEVAGLP